MSADTPRPRIEPPGENPEVLEPSLVHVQLPELSDAPEIGRMHLQACLETYPNSGLGIDEGWIREHWGKLATEEGTRFRERIIREAQSSPNVLYRVAIVDGEIGGFVHVTRDENKNILEGIYVLQKYYGKGMGPRLMDEALAFIDPAHPTEFEVAADNARAIAFYKRYGFHDVDGTKRVPEDKIPVITMRRDPAAQVA
jgi:ribosomal protein S18 acetylase RimI-like enzyme